MAHTPTLKLIYDTKNFPASANCTSCGEDMPRGDLQTAFIGEKLRWFKAQFDFHRKQKHPPKDVNQLAMRIVRERPLFISSSELPSPSPRAGV